MITFKHLFRVTVFTIFLLSMSNLRAETIIIPPSTPIMKGPQMVNSQIIKIYLNKTELELIDPSPIRGFTSKHPFALYNNYFKVKLPNGLNGFYSPELYVQKAEQGKIAMLQDFQVEFWRNILLSIIGIALAFSGVYVFKTLRENCELNSSKIFIAMTIFVVLLRQFLMLWATIHWGNFVANMADEHGYFNTALGMCNWDFSGQWTYTIGLGVLYIPFIKIFGAKEFYDIAIPFSYFSALFLAPATLVVSMLILRRLKVSNIANFCATLLWAIWPIVYHHIEGWNTNSFASFFAIPSRLWFFYHVIIGGGFNAMSDVSSTLVLFITIWIALIIPEKRRYILFIGVIFAYACLIRINNIFFAPVIAYIVLYRLGERCRNWRYLLSIFMIALGSFFMIFGWQLLLNYHQFGHPLSFPYVLHAADSVGPKPNDGFTWHTFSQGTFIKYLSGANYAVWSIGIAGLIMLKDNYKRTLLALWIVPVILFFYGYSHTFCDARRFILSTYLPMFAAFAALEVWKNIPKKILIAVLSGIILALIFVTPTNFSALWMLAPEFTHVKMFMTWIIPLYMLGLMIFLYRKNFKNIAFFVLIFSAIFFLSNGYIHATLLILILGRALWDIIYQCYQSLLRHVDSR